ncbi:E3 ubiquitin-protein ligase TRIM9-like isoform X2 [Antedon mediterranea]|uniref:E3 ubiquitin-protein ligase TRIM9-like isoform X2 n=1 Tax=Antedon mediterranea TaxID=105859 RepID=UPI003AF6F127
MDVELRCPACSGYYKSPILLPCSHNICLSCAQSIQVCGQASASVYCEQTPLNEFDYPEADRVSEADSGISFGASSAGSSSSSGGGHLQNDSLRVICPQCHRTIYLDDRGVKSFPRNKILETITDKYVQTRHPGPMEAKKCQMCETSPFDAKFYCEQCEVSYCEGCQKTCHPARGPLAKHSLILATKTQGKVRPPNPGPSTCTEHIDENLSMYCMLCKLPVCYLCLQEGKHMNHEVKALGAMSKTQKTEMSQALTSLTEKAKQAKYFLGSLKKTCETINECAIDFEASLVAKFDEMITIIQRRKEDLLLQVTREKEFKIKMVKNHMNQCSAKLRQTTGLLEFCIEVMKEPDAAAFLLFSSTLNQRVGNIEASWDKEMILHGRVTPEFDLTLDSDSTITALSLLNFKEMKVPDSPIVIPEECSVENNSVTIAWQPHPSSWVEGYVLEIDDGKSGEFREVYCGKETICTVDGLHFDSTYNARIKAYNHAGEGDYSETICLQTAEVAWFQLDPRTTHADIIFSNDNMTVTCSSYDDRVVMGNVGFSKGVHYWEITIDRYDNHPDPAFGVARYDTTKEMMLGKDDKSWSMYIDNNRSWFIHKNVHADRAEGGICVGSVIGVLLDLNRRTLTFFVNDQRQGPIAFKDLQGVFFPAISLNRNVQVTVHSGLELPPDLDTY